MSLALGQKGENDVATPTGEKHGRTSSGVTKFIVGARTRDNSLGREKDGCRTLRRAGSKGGTIRSAACRPATTRSTTRSSLRLRL